MTHGGEKGVAVGVKGLQAATDTGAIGWSKRPEHPKDTGRDLREKVEVRGTQVITSTWRRSSVYCLQGFVQTKVLLVSLSTGSRTDTAQVTTVMCS